MAMDDKEPHLIVPLKSSGSWGMIDNRSRSWVSPRVRMSMPSISIVPFESSMMRNNACVKVDLPKEHRSQRIAGQCGDFCSPYRLLFGPQRRLFRLLRSRG